MNLKEDEAGAASAPYQPAVHTPVIQVELPDTKPALLPPPEAYMAQGNDGAAKAQYSSMKTFLLACYAGAYIGLGGLLGLTVLTHCPGRWRGEDSLLNNKPLAIKPLSSITTVSFAWERWEHRQLAPGLYTPYGIHINRVF